MKDLVQQRKHYRERLPPQLGGTERRPPAPWLAAWLPPAAAHLQQAGKHKHPPKNLTAGINRRVSPLDYFYFKQQCDFTFSSTLEDGIIRSIRLHRRRWREVSGVFPQTRGRFITLCNAMRKLPEVCSSVGL